jgi:uncharacterized protein (TIGR03437 family)
LRPIVFPRPEAQKFFHTIPEGLKMRQYFWLINRVPRPALVIVFLIGLITATHLVNRAGASGTNTMQASAPVVSVNAASYKSPLAAGAISAAFGTNLATKTELAQSLPLPTQLAGTSVRLIDSRNVEHRAPLFFVSPGQINYFIPEQVATGAVQVIVTSGNGTVSRGELQIANSSPAVFTTTYDGRGLPVALTTFDGSFFETITNPDGTAKPVNPGSMWRPNYMTIFSTGLRHGNNMRVRFGSVEVTPLYAGPQGSFAGLDQVNVMIPPNLPGGLTDITLLADGQTSNLTQFQLAGQTQTSPNALSVSDVQTIIAQAVAKAQQMGFPVTVAVTDLEGNVLGVFKMTGARNDILVGSTNLQNGQSNKQFDPDGLERVTLPLPGAPPPFNDAAALAAISKAGTASFFSTRGSAISTRTASFIIQENFPPLVPNRMGGPLFGVQFSQLPCSDVKIPNLPLGLSGDPGGVPLYRNGVALGGVGIEGNGFYSIDIDPSDLDQDPEEIIAIAATRGLDTPQFLRIDNVTVDGFRLPFANAAQTGGAAPPFASLPGMVSPFFPIRPTQPSRFTPLILGGVDGRVDPRFFPFIASTVPGANQLTANDVNTIITQAAQGANRTKAAIRVGGAVRAEVNITVVDTNGVVLGIFSTTDAPIFGFDVSAQKARTAAFFSSATAGAQLNAAEGGKFAKFVTAGAMDGVRLDGSIAFSDRGMGFLARPFFPDGINGSQNGPFSKPINIWSPFNDGLQIALDRSALVNILTGNLQIGCTAIPSLANGIQIFAGSVPLFKNGMLVGAIGVSGDGIDQDDIIAATGSIGFEAPANMRSDAFFVRGVRLPFVKFPAKPNL